MKIINRYNKNIIIERKGVNNIRELVEIAVNQEANLIGANLIEADLREANLIGANLIEADLRGADLRGADLTEADLIEADLREANLIGADLIEANLIEADLREANLRGADLNCIFYNTKVTEKQKEYIINGDLFKVDK
jgi:uncharacterized protein YjbI with pentapeptide repeats